MRKLAGILLVVAVVEIAAILTLDTHDRELAEARAAYESALAENKKLTTAWEEMK